MPARREKKYSTHARVRARRTAVQACYQWLINKQPISDVIKEFESDRSELKKADKEYFSDLMEGMTRCSREIDDAITPLLDRPLAEVNTVEHAILMLGMYELLHHPELPWRVIVSEAVDLAKMFGAEKSYKYINGVLDKAAHRIRAAEIITN